jgi:hypothetical protein
MTSPYNGVATYLSTLQLMTDADSPSAQTFRVPNERLLDNDVFLKAYADAIDFKRFRSAVLHVRQLQSGTTSENALAVVASQQSDSVLVIKSGALNIFRFSDAGVPPAGASGIPSITGVVTDAVRGAGRLLVIGTGGNRCAYTDSVAGTGTYFAGGDMGATPFRLIYNPSFSRFQACRSGGSTAQYSTDGTAWSSATASTDDASGGIAMLANGDSFVCGLDAAAGAGPRFARSTNGGTSWADGATVPSPTSYANAGCVVGKRTGGPSMWHSGLAGGNLLICKTDNGTAWSLIATITPLAGATFSGQTRILHDDATGLLVVACVFDSSFMALYASRDAGVTWTPPLTLEYTALAGLGLAGGRLYVSALTNILASDGIGWAL